MARASNPCNEHLSSIKRSVFRRDASTQSDCVNYGVREIEVGSKVFSVKP